MFIVETGEGLSNGNQYTHYTEVLGYARLHYGYEWFYRTDECVFEKDEVNRAAVSASKMIDSMGWSGCRKNKHQSMEFPRAGMYDYCNKCCISCDVIPKEIKEAVIILTLSILKGDIKASNIQGGVKVKSMKMSGGMSVEFSGGAYLDNDSGVCGGSVKSSNDAFESIRHLVSCFLKRQHPNVTFKRAI